MSFPRYPKYKPSGVEALGEVPDGWSVLSLKRVVNPARQITYGIVQAGPHVPDGVPYIRPADMSAEDGIKAPDEIMRTSDEIAANYTRSTIRAGDIVCSIGPSFGKVMITPAWLDGANLTQGTARIAVQREHNSKYIFWTLRAPASVAQWVSSIGGATFSALNLGPLARTTILIPPLPEQTAIAEFLDRETGKIDGLVAEQRRLMELLKEKRQAVISHAVTKGLNPHAPMKLSGIEWLGEVPVGWTVTNIKRVGRIQYGIGEPPKYYDDGTPLIRATNVHAGELFSEGLVFVDPIEIPEKRIVWLQAGDIIVVRSGAYTGDSAIIPVGYGPCIAGFDMVLKCHSANPKFVQFALLSKYLKDGQIDLQKMRAAQPHLNAEELGSCFFLLPPAKEQDTIVQFLATELAKFDTLTAEAQRAIDLLQERRTALISAAVTGQIDVR